MAIFLYEAVVLKPLDAVFGGVALDGGGGGRGEFFGEGKEGFHVYISVSESEMPVAPAALAFFGSAEVVVDVVVRYEGRADFEPFDGSRAAKVGVAYVKAHPKARVVYAAQYAEYELGVFFLAVFDADLYGVVVLGQKPLPEVYVPVYEPLVEIEAVVVVGVDYHLGSAEAPAVAEGLLVAPVSDLDDQGLYCLREELVVGSVESLVRNCCRVFEHVGQDLFELVVHVVGDAEFCYLYAKAVRRSKRRGAVYVCELFPVAVGFFADDVGYRRDVVFHSFSRRVVRICFSIAETLPQNNRMPPNMRRVIFCAL